MRSSIIVRSSYFPMWGVYDDREARYWGFPDREKAIEFARELAAERPSAIVEVYSRVGRLERREEFVGNGNSNGQNAPKAQDGGH